MCISMQVLLLKFLHDFLVLFSWRQAQRMGRILWIHSSCWPGTVHVPELIDFNPLTHGNRPVGLSKD